MKMYKLFIRTGEDVRYEIIVESDSVLDIIKSIRLDDLYINFFSVNNPDKDSFTLFKSDIKRIDYVAIGHNPLQKFNIFKIV